jgi:hypothetical protein
MSAPIARATNKTPKGTPRPIPILLVFDMPWLDLGVDVVVEVDIGSTLAEVARDVEVAFVALVDVDGDALMKLYETGDGSSVYLFDTPNRILVILSPYDSPSVVNGWSMKLQPDST